MSRASAIIYNKAEKTLGFGNSRSGYGYINRNDGIRSTKSDTLLTWILVRVWRELQSKNSKDLLSCLKNVGVVICNIWQLWLINFARLNTETILLCEGYFVLLLVVIRMTRSFLRFVCGSMHLILGFIKNWGWYKEYSIFSGARDCWNIVTIGSSWRAERRL